jgi:hypothetical protein
LRRELNVGPYEHRSADVDCLLGPVGRGHTARNGMADLG